MNQLGILRPAHFWLWLLGCLWANTVMADTASVWLQAQPLSEMPVAERKLLQDALADDDHTGASTAVDSAASCADLLRSQSDLRPSVIESVCEYVGFELATVTDAWIDSPQRLIDARDRLLEMGVADNVGRWREFVAIQSGWLARLAAHPAADHSQSPHPAARPWQIIRALDRGQGDNARAQQILLGAPKCPQACAYAALVALARGKVALHDAQHDRATGYATRAAAHLNVAAKSQPHLVALLAPDVAVLLAELGLQPQCDQVLQLGQTALEQVLPATHAAHRHLGVTRLMLLASKGQTEDAAELLQALKATHGGRLARYPLTAARLRSSEAPESGRTQEP